MRARSRSVIAVTTKLRLLPCYPGVHPSGPNMWVERICQAAMRLGFPIYFLFLMQQNKTVWALPKPLSNRSPTR